MNLIEQLGGYEKAKAIFKNKPKYAQGWWSGVYYKQGEWCWWWSEYLKKWLQHEKHIGNSTKYTHSIKMKDIQQALLEHRRHHNTFEIGDLYVFTEKYSKQSVIHKVDSLNSGKGCIRHATPEEIKAGRRL